jgi:endonuclease-3 related protein
MAASAKRRRPRFELPAEGLQTLYAALAAAYGVQPWWPAETPFEVMVGAVLTQNAAWTNVEKAIERLRRDDMLSLPAILAADPARLADAIRPSGYFNVKAQRLRNLCLFLESAGGLEAFARLPPAVQRTGLLSVKGIGPETADDILLYALERPVFVIDAYTRRLLQRFRLARGDEDYEVLRGAFERALAPDLQLFQQYHALIVVHAKEACRKTPRCDDCALAAGCPVPSGGTRLGRRRA